ncbi:hypothetical protein [Rhizobium sp. NLR22b]|uniref:hypothetical protein n=1 Tax=Rhizobium sp. NLR22b TaxID=2731115 RepID=UPI001C832C48|nr:hypothetical protein [Rhizobium sp. NLR22b]MBX5242864.1 hypothetical protein [Rhizobium sp. NLR22b]
MKKVGTIKRLEVTTSKEKSLSDSFRELTPRDRSQVVKQILKLKDPIQKIRSVASVARDLDHLNRRKDRSSLIGEALSKLGADEEIGLFAASAIVSARNHLEPKHQTKLQKITRKRPDIVEALNREINQRGWKHDNLLLDALRENENNEPVELKRSVRDEGGHGL